MLAKSRTFLRPPSEDGLRIREPSEAGRAPLGRPTARRSAVVARPTPMLPGAVTSASSTSTRARRPTGTVVATIVAARRVRVLPPAARSAAFGILPWIGEPIRLATGGTRERPPTRTVSSLASWRRMRRALSGDRDRGDDADSTRMGGASIAPATVATGDAVGSGGGGVGGCGAGLAPGEVAGGDGAGSGIGVGAGAGTGAGAGGSAPAGGGVGTRDGRSESGSTYVSSEPKRTPKWTYGTSCSGSPDGPLSAIGSPSLTSSPRPTSNCPRWVSDALCPLGVTMVTVVPWVGTWPANETSPDAGARTARAPSSAMSRPRCCPPA
jgi:hypothetical protein